MPTTEEQHMKTKPDSTTTPSSSSSSSPTNGSTSVDPKPAPRSHRATYSKDKRKGGYLVRVEGPHAAKFVDRKVPVTRRDGSETVEQLKGVLWTGADEESGKPVALYEFEQKPRSEEGPEF
jgi:hypothetical protein